MNDRQPDFSESLRAVLRIAGEVLQAANLIGDQDNDTSNEREPAVPFDDSRKVRIAYIDSRGELSVRTIIPLRMWFGMTARHPAPQHLLAALDVDKVNAGASVTEARMNFAMADIRYWRPAG